jgi:HK97 family phage prohead protease
MKGDAVENHDFGGYATVANRKCSDGRTISPQAFAHMDKKVVPLVWQHGHDRVDNVLGHAVLEHRDNGVYAYGFFNDTPSGQAAKALVEHKDINALSIYAKKLVEQAKLVVHGIIHEVSLVLAGANPDARIDYVRAAHSEFDPDLEGVLDEDAVIFSGSQELEHSAELSHKSIQDVLDTLNEEQAEAVNILLHRALTDQTLKHSDPDEESEEESQEQPESENKGLAHQEGTMTRNVFQNNAGANGTTLQHGEKQITLDQLRAIWATGKDIGSFKKAFLQHAEEFGFDLQHAEGDYGITNIDMLFPDARAIDNKPQWITRRREWVEGVIGGTRKLPWSRIKSMSADLTHEEARAKGYIKGNMKKEQFFAIAKRETTPQTIYKKQKLDRDDIVDITDFDVVAWLWVEMYFMIREEVARAILVGDGREIDDEDKIKEDKIRPIVHDDVFYTDVVTVPTNVMGEALIEAALRARNNYKGNAPKAYMTNAVMIDMLLSKDNLGRRYHNNKSELASALGVSEIVEVPVMEGIQRNGGDVLMIIVNLYDYSIGSTKGGELTKFEDFDIDFNQYKYLIETRLSGALTEHKTAQVIVRAGGTEVTPTVPTFNTSTGVLTVPAVTGVIYKNQETNATLAAGAQPAIDPGDSISVVAVPDTGYHFPHNFDNDWTFTRDLA